MTDLMTTREVADYLRMKERKVYDLVRQKQIPCTRVAGKWLFPKGQIDQWLGSGLVYRDGAQALAPPPPVVAGSHDPFLEWCIAESGCGLALMGGGSLDGLDRLAQGQVVMCSLHVIDAETGEYNVPAIERALGALDVVAVEWAMRQQGLVVAPGNPLKIRGLADLPARRARPAWRQPGSGARILMDRLLEEAGVPAESLPAGQTFRSEIEVGLAVLDGRADAALAVQAVARQLKLGFVPVHQERYDLVMRRRDFFGPAVQRLLAFARTPEAKAQAADLQGYDTDGLGTVRYNGP